MSNVSIYAFRQEKGTLTEVLTSSIAKIVQNMADRERLGRSLPSDKEMPPAVDFGSTIVDDQTLTPALQGLGVQIGPENRNTSAQIKSLTVQNTIDKSELEKMELKLDGCTRFHALPNNRLMIIMENQDKWIVHFRFDQAD